MMDDVQRRRRNRKRLWLVLATAVVLVAGLVVPPMISIGRYKARITELMSQSLGRPVRLSSVELRLMPRPAFVLTNLTVEEDPAFGAEPLLHANTVTAAIRLLPLWRGRLAISSISVDEASLNLVRAPNGRWNLDPLFRTAAAHSRSGVEGEPRQLPYLEATNSRVNIKNGLEKLPFSLVDADISFWQDDPGVWRLRLRGQPARTDVQLDLADTGIVKLEASLYRAPELREMPIRVDMEWSQAQLGQLSRLIIGSDPGWRGDLTADLHLSGTPDSAKVTTRLRATGVHRAEFAPASPLDFDANCSFDYHYTSRSVANLACDSPLGDGQVRLGGDLPGNASPTLSLAVQKIPAQAGLDLLRTLRSGIDEDLEAEGTVSGELKYDVAKAAQNQDGKTARSLSHARAMAGEARRKTKASDAAAPLLTGSLVVEGFQLRSGALRQPIQIPKITLAPAEAAAGEGQALTTAVTLPEGGSSLLSATLRLGVHGYQATLQGPASLGRLRQWAAVAGLSASSPLDGLSGDAVLLQLHAQGPWLPEPEPLFPGNAASGPGAAAPPAANHENDRLSGTMEFHEVKWKSSFLANEVEISQAVLTLGGNMLVWDPVAFAYGPVKGAASLQVPLQCEEDVQCPPRVEIHFGELDAGKLEAALLGARRPDTLLSSLLARFQSSVSRAWPQAEGTVEADALTMGPFALQNVTATARTQAGEANVEGFHGELLGGTLQGSGSVTNGKQPSYALEGSFDKLNSQAVCNLLELRCKGGTISGDGKLAFAGFAGEDVGATAKGTMHFDWRRGTLTAMAGTAEPPALAHFDRWTGEAAIANGAMTLEQNQVQRGARAKPVQATITFGNPPKVAFEPRAAHKPQGGKPQKHAR
ncbi:MAG TPA: AsmA family protein [Terracidiphilus sp.]|nr:AsmA family protein [Terracidiphilus sp.]